jgi:hypothetical protein
VNNISIFGKNLAGLISENSPTILSSLAVAGLVSTVVLAVKATPRAMELLEEERDRPCNEYRPNGLYKREIIRVTWRCYIPAAACGIATIVCIIQANTINQRRIAAVAGAYTIAERALQEYQSKVVETIGKNKEQRVRDEIASDRIKKNPPSANEVIITGKGEVLCYDSQTGRYFKSSIEEIRQAVNLLNMQLMNEHFVPLNDLYFALGIKETKLGEDLGWKVEDGLIEIKFSTQFSEDEVPCLVLNYDVVPRYLR